MASVLSAGARFNEDDQAIWESDDASVTTTDVDYILQSDKFQIDNEFGFVSQNT